jgi:cytochrome c-type biogenesis protein CcmH
MVAVLLALAALSFACSAKQEVPAIERLAQEINKGVMCPVCPGESIDQSQHPQAVQMRGIVVEKLEQGWTGGRIRDFFVERYGPSVLLDPPTEGFNLVVWLVPPGALAAALVALYLVLRTMVRPRRASSDGAVELTAEERAGYVGRVEAALASDGGDGPVVASGHSRGTGDEAAL